MEMASLDSAGITSGIIVDTTASDVLSQAQASSSLEYLKAANVGLEATDILQQPVEGDAQERLQTFWQKQMEDIQNLSNNEFKTQDLPLARIKKIMKMDDDVKMISAEAPLLFSKAAQIFITELSLRAWVHTEENKRRTLQRNDIATAITKFDQFDFLIDIVPREELKPMKRTCSSGGSSDAQQYFYPLPQQQQQQATVSTPMANTRNTGSQSVGQASALQSGQLLISQPNQNGQSMTLIPANVDGAQILQLAQTPQPQGHSAQQTQAQAVVLNTASGNAGQVMLQAQRQQQATPQTSHSNDQKQQQNIQAILQQLVGNASNTQGEVHAIQVNSQGQLQLVKVVNPQPQQQVQSTSTNTAAGSLQISGGTNQIYNIGPGDTNATQAMGDISTIYVNPGE